MREWLMLLSLAVALGGLWWAVADLLAVWEEDPWHR